MRTGRPYDAVLHAKEGPSAPRRFNCKQVHNLRGRRHKAETLRRSSGTTDIGRCNAPNSLRSSLMTRRCCRRLKGRQCQARSPARCDACASGDPSRDGANDLHRESGNDDDTNRDGTAYANEPLVRV